MANLSARPPKITRRMLDAAIPILDKETMADEISWRASHVVVSDIFKAMWKAGRRISRKRRPARAGMSPSPKL